jgi:hypothetical protein
MFFRTQRERTSQSFRDALHRDYRSSKASKKHIRLERIKSNRFETLSSPGPGLVSRIMGLEHEQQIPYDHVSSAAASAESLQQDRLPNSFCNSKLSHLEKEEQISLISNKAMTDLEMSSICSASLLSLQHKHLHEENDDESSIAICHGLSDIPTASFLCESALFDE